MDYNPADYLTAEQLMASPKLRREYEELKAWAAKPTQIGPRTVSKFLATIRHGLMNGRRHRPAHRLHYIDWALSAIETQLRTYNQQLKSQQIRP